jgi:hypothetical protein
MNKISWILIKNSALLCICELCSFLVLDWTMYWSYQEIIFLWWSSFHLTYHFSWIGECGVPFLNSTISCFHSDRSATLIILLQNIVVVHSKLQLEKKLLLKVDILERYSNRFFMEWERWIVMTCSSRIFVLLPQIAVTRI